MWTLRYEWLFYARLLFTGPLCRNWLAGLVVPPLLLVPVAAYTLATVASSLGTAPVMCVLQFLAGMSVAYLRSAFPARALPESIGSAAMIGVLLLVFGIIGDKQSTFLTLSLGAFFALVACGHGLFGLLQSTPARRLGDISYGV